MVFDLLKLPVGEITRYWLGAMAACGPLVRIIWGRYAFILLLTPCTVPDFSVLVWSYDMP